MKSFRIAGQAGSTKLIEKARHFAATKKRGDGPAAFFSNGQINVLTALFTELEKRGTLDDKALTDMIYEQDQASLHQVLKGTEADMFIDPEVGGSAAVLTMLRMEVAGMN